MTRRHIEVVGILNTVGRIRNIAGCLETRVTYEDVKEMILMSTWKGILSFVVRLNLLP